MKASGRNACGGEPGVRIKDIAADFGISESCLQNWLTQADRDDGVRPGPTVESPWVGWRLSWTGTNPGDGGWCPLRHHSQGFFPTDVASGGGRFDWECEPSDAEPPAVRGVVVAPRCGPAAATRAAVVVGGGGRGGHRPGGVAASGPPRGRLSLPVWLRRACGPGGAVVVATRPGDQPVVMVAPPRVLDGLPNVLVGEQR
jgi:hypothetical protein